MNQAEEQYLEGIFKEMTIVAELAHKFPVGSTEAYSSVANRLPSKFQEFMEYNASWVDTTVLSRRDLFRALDLHTNIREFWFLAAELKFLRSLGTNLRSVHIKERISYLREQIEILCSKFNALTGEESYVALIRKDPDLNGHNSCFLEDAQNEGMKIALSFHEESK